MNQDIVRNRIKKSKTQFKMKKLIFIFGVIIPIICNSQDDIGKLYIETSTTLFSIGSGNYNAFIGKTDISLKEFKIQYYSLAPRIGYHLTNLVAIGADFQFYNEKYGHGGNLRTTKYKNILYGVFLRQYFLNKKINPFIEISTGIGTSNYIEEFKYSVGNYLYNISYISGAIGCSFTLNPRFKLDISATIQNTIEKQKDSGQYHVDRFSTFESELIMSISYYFKKNKRKSNLNKKTIKTVCNKM
jgi:hypothetical protein